MARMARAHSSGKGTRVNSEERLALLLHDLRTPLSAMRLTADLIAQDGLTRRQSERMDLLLGAIDALVEMTREAMPGAGDAVDTREAAGKDGALGQDGRHDLARLVQDIAALFRPRAEDEGRVLLVEPAGRQASLPLSRAVLLRRALGILLDNALRYGAGPIRVTTAFEDAGDSASPGVTLVLRVTDCGPGIPADLRSRLFQAGARGAAEAHPGGHGLGLFGARELLREAGGDLALGERQDGEAGAVFDLRIPLGVEDLAPARVELADDATCAEADAHVLLIEDHGPSRQLIASVLGSFNLSCDLAVDVEAALGLLDRRSYDGFLVDLHLGSTSGLAFAYALKALAGLTVPPVLLLTAAPERITAAVREEAGILAVVAKPIDPAALYEALRPVFRHRQALSSGAD